MNEQQQIRNNRLVLLTIAGIPLTMILAASWLWYFVVEGDLDLVGTFGTANRGQLVQPPRQLDDYLMRDDQEAPVKYSDLPRKWSLVVANQGPACGPVCERSLYVTRQIHIAMGKEFNRIDRLYLSEQTPAATRLEVSELSDQHPAPAAMAELLATEHRGMKALTLAAGAYQELFPEQQRDASTWYLVDPAGWVMMSYNSGIHYKDVISDLKFLLKNSSE
ncbi:hypothetical protein DWB85_09205 [Seongchinamella sediminis]|uniref:Cytochrome oxidase Cu insertion factor, SCO1/SenC/PrrC family n=1 Tax=Seongchinamella sediminis TaxID=2283635 RepID=A0A3L7E1A2_9GAMM|nr:hypothetical protein [Seongchinamella sediminis]RLQ22103.1 hypothetical protein DWB85_09205 [Seongchinamella sediminis]